MFNVDLLASDPVDEPVEYHWSFGDQSESTVFGNASANMSHKYMTTQEAGFTVSVTAKTNSSGINVAAIAKAIVHKPIQRKLPASSYIWGYHRIRLVTLYLIQCTIHVRYNRLHVLSLQCSYSYSCFAHHFDSFNAGSATNL